MDVAPLSVAAILPNLPVGGSSRPLLVLADDGRQYWLKPVNNPQRPIIPVVEQIVGRCGGLINVPVRPVELIRIPEEFIGHEVGQSYVLQAGIAHGSLDLAGAQFTMSLDHAERDRNFSRYLGIVALYDWCWGDDPQWLYESGGRSDHEYHSHDHGEYLFSREEWTHDAIMARIDEPHVLSMYPSTSTLAGFVDLADRLQAVTHEQLVDALAAIPVSWSVSDTQLELLGFFLERRRDAVATRVRERYLHHET